VRRWVAGIVVLLTGCTAAPKLPNSQTASEQYSTLGYREKFIARNFYDLGSGDAIKRLYWAQRRAQETSALTESQPATNLERKYVVIPVPEHVDPDGTVKEASNQVVEVVHLVEMRRSHSRNLIIVK
jgi:hypothetical protein